MAASSWKLTVTFLGSQASARELVIRAENWPSALREGRHQLGEEGGVPAGASCAVSSSGIVTVLAPAERRRYLLEPIESHAAPHAPATASTPSPAANTPAPASTPKAATSGAAPAGSYEHIAADALPSSGREQAYSPTLPAPAAHPSEPAPSRSVKATLAYSAERAEALRKEFETARARAAFGPSEREPVGSPLDVRAREQSSPAAAPVGAAQVTPSALDARALGAARESESALEPARRSSLPAPAAALRNAPRPSAELSKPRGPGGSVYGLRGDGLALLIARDLDPSSSSPLTYRERAYLLGGSADRVRLEVLLQAELACLRRELAGRPRGQFVRLGVFREPFEGNPTTPPLATLEWKDWRGRAIFQLSEEMPAEAARLDAPFDARNDRASRELDAAANAEASFASALANTRGSEPLLDSPVEPDPFARAAVPPAMPPARDSDPFGAPVALPARPASVSPPAAPRPSSLPPPAQPARPNFSLPPPAGGPAATPNLHHADESHASEREGRNSEPDTRLAAAFESMPDLHLLPTPVAGLEFTVELLSQLVPCEAISGCLYDVDTDEFRFVALSGLGALDRKASAIRANAGLFGAAARGRTDALLVTNASAEPRYAPAIDGRPSIQTKNLAYVPVRHHGQLLGMLQLMNRDLPQGFSQSDVSVLTYVGAQLGEFLANCRAFVD